MTQFTGFTPQTIDFLWELRMNNHKAFMEENRQRYQTVLKEPFDCLTKELIQRIEEIGKGMPRQASISRINRDIRFSKDKSPYRPKRWMVLHDGKQAGTDWKCQPVFYFELTPEAYYTGMGLYDSTPAPACQASGPGPVRGGQGAGVSSPSDGPGRSRWSGPASDRLR